jgi:hypothetical protein
MPEPEVRDVLPKAKTAEGKALRERFRYALTHQLTAAQGRLVNEAIHNMGKDEVLRMFERSGRSMGATLTALSKLTKASS